ncbi:MAG: hypothetical protein JWL75_14 [Parcubacteria group bacterium]|nr:hypothetical protein [Parcubacteria group bacterium]
MYYTMHNESGQSPLWCPHLESNQDQELRSLLLYPLSYEGDIGRAAAGRTLTCTAYFFKAMGQQSGSHGCIFPALLPAAQRVFSLGRVVFEPAQPARERLSSVLS